MKEEVKKKNIYETICAVMTDIPAIGKTNKNVKQGFNFRSVDQVMNALQPIFTKHKLFVVPEVLEQHREERKTSTGGTLLFSICKIKYTFYAEDGSNISSIVIGEGMDSGDKASNKALAVAFKYALFQVFCIPTEEMKDPDKEPIPQTISTNEYMKLKTDFEELIIATNTERKEIYNHYRVTKDTELNANQFKEAINILKAKLEKQRAENQNRKDIF